MEIDKNPESTFNLSETKRALLKAILKGERIANAQEIVIPPREADVPVPLSFSQQRLWFINQLESGKGTYNLPSARRLKGFLDVKALQASLNDIVARHEILRTSFKVVGGEPRQVIENELSVEISVEDLSGYSPDEREQKLRNLISDARREPFDLSQAPIFRVNLYRVDVDEHVLTLVFHHAVIDEWSYEIFYKELNALYEAYVNQRQVNLPDLPIQYADYTLWQRDRMQGELLERQLGYWVENLSGAPEIINLPTDYTRPPVPSLRGGSQDRLLPKELQDGLKNFSQEERVTMFTALLSAFQVFISRYSGQNDVVVGTPIANRGQGELENLIGFFLNMLVLRANLRGNPSFRQVLKRLEHTVLEAFDNQDLPFERLVEELQPGRNLAWHPLFQVVFVYHPLSERAMRLTGLEIEPIKWGPGQANVDLTLSASEREDGLYLDVSYSAELFEPSTIERMLANFEAMLWGILRDPDMPIRYLPILTDAEQRLVLEEWRGTNIEIPEDKGVHHLFEEQVKLSPDSVALVFEDQPLNYSQLNAKANQLARYLMDRGVSPELLVGIYTERTIEVIVAILATLKAGGVYVPLDPDYPVDRLSFILNNSGIKALVVGTGLNYEDADGSLSVVHLDRDWLEISQMSEDNPAGAVYSDNLAYVIYTSGSTGDPKGVQIAHRGLCSLVESIIRKHKFKDKCRLLHTVSFSFDAATYHMLLPLSVGGTLYLVNEKSRRIPSDLGNLLREYAITYAPFTASVLALLPKGEFSDLEIITAGAEACSPELVARWAPGRRFFNMYGPTEATIVSTIDEGFADEKIVTIGRPVPNWQTFILDEHLQPVPVGVPGELFIGGVGLSRGYLNNPGLTAEYFVPNPYSEAPGERLYRTGDRVRFRPDGRIEYIGRKDDQVKLRGFRIELGEIEAAIAGFPGVNQAVVMMREDEPRDQRLVAYVVPAPGEIFEESALLSHLKDKLPGYMIPWTIVILDEIPLTGHGKIDRLALPVPQGKRSRNAGEYEPPVSDLERVMAEIWGELLQVNKVGRFDNFFEMGGHSLLAIRLTSQVNEAFGEDLPLRVIFESPKLMDYAEALEREAGDRLEEVAQFLLKLVELSEFEAKELLDGGSTPREQDGKE